MAIRIAAELCDLDFLPLEQEIYKLAVPGSYLAHARLGSWLDAVLGEMGAAARAGVSGYCFDTLGRLAPIGARPGSAPRSPQASGEKPNRAGTSWRAPGARGSAARWLLE
jgi:hypothetical protein